MDFPALFVSADRAASREQTTYLRVIRLEYGLLIVASLAGLKIIQAPPYFALIALIFVGSISLLLFRSLRRPEQDWYMCRALAESVRTSAWRYVMRAEPFASDDVSKAQAEFRSYLADVLRSNRQVGRRIAHFDATGAQTTASMDNVRAMSLAERRAYYLAHRVRHQRQWYSANARRNARAARRWTIACVTVYLVAITLVLARISYPAWTLWPTETFIVVASAIIGWMQIKKFNELSSAYTLTAHEIGFTEESLANADSESQLSHLVNEAELVFSREHTQWVARRT